ncbi:16S rRNA (adenine(1518)-N(6)/adenine(1519)-N(6))-dimethyltransferase RsmA [Leptospira sp. 2 VSF19]|uniref:16S rRNA (Adenine(1518)-N(6)/adenine(1519)-N(6))-dimethyltransferase RsmA n=1 Tax=Leptospira soteropolitanensis TaxID=2950025 RepID=A0AAW5VNY9_9LEPT|nr:16S rRNA (adenine(1518)-N(6)/adenine(1519)-N(6))-dimethyltransferase RsmA [Leptospira soteropolitanensis]MCW7494457.1 16S rRNA (adenine(1518)-N(6)/adenine(1519)-N(6))-dimethyltransferase RsmA [Leptospira soteropolitanensis]MCW7502051.1 16S rRNA (adenine(1518)-N(6)/adenine(1519)-N(6))-dimethyltransferase RsmA [Leptospira soteropolitanensis]MCW7524303.1 16S rRNA (adenine(1518)-N(6)/adenine(1519)-N(6))-dimethyltransferase RsmA [Leptospira soteropolitanensis]MCW7528168.1 16S rRNA (adenine(1518)-
MKSPYSTISKIQTFFEAKGIRAQKKFGQNFLIDQNIVDFIVRSAEPLFNDDSTVLAEIGIGLGTLTYPILSLNQKTYLFEIDNAYIELAKDEILPQFPKAFLYEGDALENLYSIYNEKVFVFGNLPYHLTTEIINTLVIHCRNFQGGIFMVQKEFAERLVKETSSLSVFLSAFCDVKYLKTVHKNCFFPIPKIHSALILLSPKKESKENQWLLKNQTEVEIWSRMLRTLFWGKRKQIQVSLRESPFSEDPHFREALGNAIQSAKIPPTARPEELNREQFLTLGQHLLDHLSK